MPSRRLGGSLGSAAAASIGTFTNGSYGLSELHDKSPNTYRDKEGILEQKYMCDNGSGYGHKGF